MKLMEYLKANRDFRPIRKIAFDLKHLLKAEKINGKVKDTFGKEKSCPTWHFKENPKNFVITLAPGQQQQQIENKENEED